MNQMARDRFLSSTTFIRDDYLFSFFKYIVTGEFSVVYRVGYHKYWKQFFTECVNVMEIIQSHPSSLKNSELRNSIWNLEQKRAASSSRDILTSLYVHINFTDTEQAIQLDKK